MAPRSKGRWEGRRLIRAYAFSDDLYWAKMHVKAMHKIYVEDVKTLNEIRECHDAAHADQQGYPHEHAPKQADAELFSWEAL